MQNFTPAEDPSRLIQRHSGDGREAGGDSGALALCEVKPWRPAVNPRAGLDSEVSLAEDGVTVLMQRRGVALQPFV